MLDFVNHYYEVTEENKDTLHKLIVAEDIHSTSGQKISSKLDFYTQVGFVLGNISDKNPKHTGYWCSKFSMYPHELEKVTTKVPIELMTME